ncbi:PREDICTED: ribonuclease kappa [Pseudopodoces humilis]|uniref:ribonuclease kappa n=1 Tax=Pseudopodoces humilis TaxID=181119 RepID=UPI0006B744DB|nr:PREDICTED: ribonuclease kappa [Pseudopodoces humilis]
MVSLLCCGPKMAACGLVLSAWGVVMLVLGSLGPERIYGLYEQVSYNCFIAAGLYALLGGFSLCQTRLNKRKEYMVR